MTRIQEGLIFERSREGKIGCIMPELDVPAVDCAQTLGEKMTRSSLKAFPQVSEVEVVRHFTRLSQWNFGVNQGMYPLGSCTMKYNPSINEKVAGLPGFTHIHPLSSSKNIQGVLKMIVELEKQLCEITGLQACTLQPAAGAHGEFTGLLTIRGALKAKGQQNRDTILVPDSAHGTNPATATLAGFRVKEVASNAAGRVDMQALEEAIDDHTAGMMLTNPNTLGIFESNIHLIAEKLHQQGAYLYMDGANMNALVGKAKPGDMGVDLLHLNLHKTFSTPHGGGGPGSGPVCATEELAAYLPRPRIRENERGELEFHCEESSVGRVHGWQGHFGVMLRAMSWIFSLGAKGLREHTENAVLNNHYLRHLLKGHYHLPYETETLHETVFTDKYQMENGVSTRDIAKKLLDFGFHPPTVYFPLVVSGALMIEPTETESRGEIERFAAAMVDIAKMARESPEQVTSAPTTTVIGRLDETLAARKPVLKWVPDTE
ncbi:MAG: glycine dehydrogenase (aminomethyl-transferring) [Acidobacteria bacterium]|nr:MAG: glycine dehydrogenase (aminomethyl-transferring) [Acidobacteriota bacterium]